MNTPGESLKQTYNLVAEDYALIYANNLQFKPFDQKILDHFSSIVAKEHICDVGCGPGSVTSYLVDKSLNVTGIDNSEVMVLVAKSIRGDIEFLCEDIFQPSFEANKFSGITSFGLISHYDFDAINHIFRAIHHILKPGGIFLFNYYVGQGSLFLNEFLNKKTPMNYHFFQKEEIQRTLITQDFQVDIFLEREAYKDLELNYPVGFCFARKK